MRAHTNDEPITFFLAKCSRRSSVIALTEGPLPDAHDYAYRDYVESFFDVAVDYANARRNDFSWSSGVWLPLMHTVGALSPR